MNDSTQARVGKWVIKCFGAAILGNRRERAMRLLEEAIELAQCEGIDVEDVARLAGRVHSRRAGNPKQEIGGVGVTLLAYGEAAGMSVSECVQEEVRRIEQPEIIELCRKKQREKAADGVAVDVP